MPIVNPLPMLRAAREGRYAVGAFNVVDYLTIEAVVRAAEKKRAPVIVQTSSGTIKRFGVKALAKMAADIAGPSPVPVALHLDHGSDRAALHEAIVSGYSSVMIDASKYPFDENVRRTKDVVEEAHARGLSVEGEIGVVAGVEDDIVVRRDKAIYTTPEEAIEFQKRTGVDFLAAAIGTAHGFYKTEPKLDIETLAAIRARTDFPLVIHGGTGLAPDVVRRLVAEGGSKFNLSTQIKQIYIDALHGYIGEHREEYDILKVLKHAHDRLVEMIAEHIAVLGSEGKA
jgi:fructose-bisphosphate aldolase class II